MSGSDEESDDGFFAELRDRIESGEETLESVVEELTVESPPPGTADHPRAHVSRSLQREMAETGHDPAATAEAVRERAADNDRTVAEQLRYEYETADSQE
ncbi:hypothetical protein [Halobaculum sp. P14]|uniref:hypothetical protein n=1 Tax=Halobaculum sp. P14 TaxID=3421638 RepID=UPI003EBC87D4